jgi:putative membrane protein involved in polysaccharide export
MKKLKQLILGVLLAIVLISCQSYKKVPYLQDMTQVSDTEQGGRPIGVKVMPKDLLTITVSCSTPELAAPFNLVNPDSESSAPQQYLVDNQGNINFPVLGEIHVGGLTKLEIENLIIEKLKVYLKEAPLVTVRIANYRISVLGEVAKPGSFVVSNEKINLLEALAMAGDLTIYGMRDNVKLIRTGQDNKQEIITFDLNKTETVMSPYYQLQQNDIVYVTPNKTKAKNSDIGVSTGLWISGVSVLLSITNLLLTILR